VISTLRLINTADTPRTPPVSTPGYVREPPSEETRDDKEYCANEDSRDHEFNDCDRLFRQFSRDGGAPDVQPSNPMDHRIDARPQNGAGQEPCFPIEDGEGDERKTCVPMDGCMGYDQNESDQRAELDPLSSVHLHLQKKMHFACHRNRSPVFAFTQEPARYGGITISARRRDRALVRRDQQEVRESLR
jgi:hypothetical protein